MKGKGKKEALWIENPVRPKLLSIKSAAQYLGVSVWRVRELVWQGKLPVVRLGGRKLWLDLRDLDALVEASKERFL